MDRIKICEENDCTGCAACVQVCPQKCISMVENHEGFNYPQINGEKCIRCGRCVKHCPNNQEQNKSKSHFYMGMNNDSDILNRSSSGGMFSAIADYVLDQGGIVVGAAHDVIDNRIKHVIIDDRNKLDAIRGSKYYQSDTSNIYNDVISFLKVDKTVLFSGTACQVAGLLSVVPDKLKAKLLTVDVLCHGVSSKKTIDSFISSQEKRFKKKIDDYRFRIKDKELGWKSGCGTKMIIMFEDGESYVEKKKVDDFFMIFNGNCSLRESCYRCKYCGTERIADFTLADFWGVTEERASVTEQHNGISLLLCNSIRAKDLLPDLRDRAKIIEIDPSEAIPFNNALVAPNKRPSIREKYFKLLNSGVDFRLIVLRLFWKNRLKEKIKSWVGEERINIIKRKLSK